MNEPTCPATEKPVTLERAAALLAEIEVSCPFHIDPVIHDVVITQFVADLFAVDLERVKQIVELCVEQERQFRIHDGEVAIRLVEEGRSVEAVLGKVDVVARTAQLFDPHFINRSEQLREDVISSTEISECRSWLELKGFQVTEVDG